MNMLNIALFGPPGAGKGTQSKKLIEKYRLAYISTGDILRQEIAKGTKLGQQAKTVIERGQLVDDETIVQIIEGFIANHTDARGVLFDGFPRTYVQAYILEGMLQRINSELSCMISLEVPKDELKRRLLERAKVSGRSDDAENVITNRLKEYDIKTAPVAQYYKERDLYYPVDGTGTIDEIFENIDGVIQETLKGRLFNVVILGMPGSGKDQTEQLAEEFGLKYISTGRLLRQEIKDNTELGQKAKGHIDKGSIVPDEIAIKLIEREINNNPDAKGFIFKGYPLSIVQAYILDGLLRKKSSSINLVIDLEISMLESFKRLFKRGKTEQSRLYDENPESIIRRIEKYDKVSSKVPAYYQKNMDVEHINGHGTREEVYERLRMVMKESICRLR